MFFHHNGNLAWLSIAKNACTSWIRVFDELGWKKENLYRPETDISQLKFFGFMRDPNQRHTMGVVEYLERSGLLSVLNSAEFGPLLAAGVFDEHSYAISHLVPDSILDRTSFFIIDHRYFDYQVLVQNFLDDHGISISVPVPRLNSTATRTREYRQRLQEIKSQRIDIHSHLMQNFLAPDTVLYEHHVQLQNQWSRPDDDYSRRYQCHNVY